MPVGTGVVIEAKIITGRVTVFASIHNDVRNNHFNPIGLDSGANINSGSLSFILREAAKVYILVEPGRYSSDAACKFMLTTNSFTPGNS